MTILTNIPWLITAIVTIFIWLVTIAAFFWAWIMGAVQCWADVLGFNTVFDKNAQRTTAMEALWSKNPISKIFCVLLVISIGLTYTIAATYPF